MRFFVLSDIHSNIEALEACCRRARDEGYDSALCCGDIVGYGPNPCETIDRLLELKAQCIRGNHDRVAAGLGNADDFNMPARQAIYWTREQLTDSHRAFLTGLPLGPLAVGENAQLAHGALTDEDDYITGEREALENLLLAEREITFFGHTHHPVIYGLNPIGSRHSSHVRRLEARGSVAIDSIPKLFINPGAVGQPRDGDSRAAFAIWDEEERRVEFHRVEYPIARTQARMRDAGLPAFLINRLSAGR